MPELQTIRLTVTIKTDSRVDRTKVLHNVESALSLMAVPRGDAFRDSDVEDGRIMGYLVEYAALPSDEDGPFTIHEHQPGGGFDEEPESRHDTAIAAFARAHELEASGVFVEILDSDREYVYSSAA